MNGDPGLNSAIVSFSARGARIFGHPLHVALKTYNALRVNPFSIIPALKESADVPGSKAEQNIKVLSV